MCISPCMTSATDGYHIYSGHANGFLKVWTEKQKGAVIDKQINSGKISHLLLAKNDNYLVSGPILISDCKVSLSRGKEISIFEMRTQNVVKSVSIENLNLSADPISFGIDRELSRIFLGDSDGKGHVRMSPL